MLVKISAVSLSWNLTGGDVKLKADVMETMISVWTVVEHVRVASGAAEVAIFTAILYWFFTSSRVADMLEVLGERVGGWCGRESGSLRQAVRARRRQQNADMYAKLDADVAVRTTSLYRVKESPVVPAPQPETRPPAGLACGRCAPVSRDSWHDPKIEDSGTVINVLDIGRQNFANSGVISRYFCDLAQCFNLVKFQYKDVIPDVQKDPAYIKAIEDTTEEELKKTDLNLDEKGDGDNRNSAGYLTVKKRVEARAKKVLTDISSAMSYNILRVVAWLTHKAIRRVAGGGCGTRAGSVARLRRATAAGLPLVFVPLHRSHFDYILVTFALYLTGLRPPLVAAGDNMRIPFFGWILRGCGAFYIRRRVDGSEHNGDPVYKAALRSYIINSLAANNNLEFFIEGGRTRTGKPQPPKAGILSVIMDAYLDGTIDDALLVPVTLNYDKLVDGNFVREQLGMPKQMETFWSALRGIWRTMNTNHGSIRVDFNQPISLKELVQSFKKYNHFKAPIEAPLGPADDKFSSDLDRRLLYNHSHSSLYGDDVSTDHKMMVEAIGRHIVYEGAQATAVMCTNVVSYVLLTEARGGAGVRRAVRARGAALRAEGRDLAYRADPDRCLEHALEMLGPLVQRERRTETLRPTKSIAAELELSYYANTLVAHYAAPAIVATALESIVCRPDADGDTVRHPELLGAALQLYEVLSEELILCAPCHTIHETLLRALDQLLASGVLVNAERTDGLEEEKWSRRLAKTIDDEEDDGYERPDPTLRIKYIIQKTPEAIAERRRLLLTLRPLIESYSASCRHLAPGTVKSVVKATIDGLVHDYTTNEMPYGAAVSSDAVRNCLRLLRQWGVIEMYTDNKERKIRLRPPYDDAQKLNDICSHIYKFNVDSPLLKEESAT